MSDFEEDVDSEPPTIDPYEVLDLERTATEEQVRKAYRKAALQHHPDKVPDDPDKKAAAHETFQSIAFAYAILSDPTRRKRYDETGSTSESIVDSEGFNWSEYYRTQFKDAVSADAIEQFARQYRGSQDEIEDLLDAFELFEGNMTMVYERVILSDEMEDGKRFRTIINDAIDRKRVPSYKIHYDGPQKRDARLNKLKKEREAEAKEAESYAKELGVHDKLYGKKKGGKGKESSEDDLAALIQRRQQDRSSDSNSFLDRIAEKYGAPAKGKKAKKRGSQEEPPEEAFEAMAARQEGSKRSGKTEGTTRSKRAKR